MLNQLKSLFGLSESESTEKQPLEKNVAAAALMVHVMVADGKITPDEEAKLAEVLREHYSVSDEDAKSLADKARDTQSEAIDMYRFTSILKSEMDESERLALIEDLWEMVFADGKVHEFEDNVIWRVAELLGIHSRERMVLKKRVVERRS